MLHDGKSQARAARLARAALLAAIEALEHLGLLLGGDAGARVCHDEQRALVLQRHRDVNPAALVVVADRVVAQIVDELVEQARVALNDARLAGGGDGDACLLGHGSQARRHLPCHVQQVHGLGCAEQARVPRALGLVELGEREDVVDELGHVVGLVVDAPGELRDVLGPRDAVTDELRGTRDGRERRLELVRHVGGELAAHEVGAAQLLDLLGDALDEWLDLHVGDGGVRLCRVDGEDGRNEAVCHEARGGPAHGDDDEHDGAHEQQVVAHGGRGAVSVDRQAQDVAVGKADGAVDGHVAARLGVALGRAGAVGERLGDLWAVGVVGHGGHAVLVVIEHGAVRAHERDAHVAGVKGREAHDVRVVAAQRRAHHAALALEHAAGVIDRHGLVDERGAQQHGDGRHGRDGRERDEEAPGKRRPARRLLALLLPAGRILVDALLGPGLLAHASPSVCSQPLARSR